MAEIVVEEIGVGPDLDRGDGGIAGRGQRRVRERDGSRGIGQFPAISRWYEDLCEIDAWRDPFQGIEAPELPPVRRSL
jgi:hypothetical protein